MQLDQNMMYAVLSNRSRIVSPMRLYCTREKPLWSTQETREATLVMKVASLLKLR